MNKVYVCYMVSTGIDNTTNILGVYDSLDKAICRNFRAYWNILNNERIFDNRKQCKFFGIEKTK